MSENKKSNRNSALGERLKFLREQWQQSVREVCSTLEIEEKTLRAYEEGSVLPTPEVLDMLINHFLLTEDQAQDLRELAEDQQEENESAAAGSLEDMLAKQLIMLLPIDSRVVYTDSMQATVNEHGVILQFMQQTNGQPVPVSKVGMSRQHAERVLKVLQDTLQHHDQSGQKMLPSSDDQSHQK